MKEGSLGKRTQKTGEVSIALDDRRRELFSKVHDIATMHSTPLVVVSSPPHCILSSSRRAKRSEVTKPTRDF